MSNFRNLHAKIKAENAFTIFFTGDFNTYFQFWWPDGDSTPEGTEIEHLLTSLGLSQIISEPTSCEPNIDPSCIDLDITDHPNLVLDSGPRSSVDPFCAHQIVYCKVNFRIPRPPPPPPHQLIEKCGTLIERTHLPLKDLWPVFPGLDTL